VAAVPSTAQAAETPRSATRELAAVEAAWWSWSAEHDSDDASSGELRVEAPSHGGATLHEDADSAPGVLSNGERLEGRSAADDAEAGRAVDLLLAELGADELMALPFA
jgi:hypothetical protein